MSKIRANTQIIPATLSRNLLDASLEADLVKYTDDIASINTLKADITYVDTKITDLIGGAPEALDTLQELSAALANDADYATTITNQMTTINGRLDSAEGRLDAIDADTGVIKVADLVRGEVPTGAVDGVNAVFTLAREPRVGSVMVYKNGVADFSPDITVNEAAKTVTFAVAPATDDKVHMCYEAVRA